MATNKVVKLKLETRAVKLREEGNTFENIALILSEETNNRISYSNVYRFFESYEKSKAIIIEKQEPLKVRYVEADISTIEDRIAIIKGLKKLAETADEDRDRVLAYKTANEALDSLDKRLGKIPKDSGVTVNNVNAIKLTNIPTDQLLRMINES